MTDPEESTDSSDVARTPVDHLAIALFDEAAGETGCDQAGAIERRALADLQWLEALLEQTWQRHRQRMDDNVAAVLRRLRCADHETILLPSGASPDSDWTDDETPGDVFGFDTAVSRGGPPRNTRFALARRRVVQTFAMSATLLVAAGLWWFLQPSPVQAMVESALRSAQADLDRTYDVTIQPIGPATPPRLGTLWVRGARKFVYSHPGPGPLGARFQIGSDGREFWFIPPIGPALVHNHSGMVGEWLDRAGGGLPFLQLTTLIERLKADYDLSTGAAEVLVPGGRTYQRLTGRLRTNGDSAATLIPRQIDVWLERETGIVEQLTMSLDENRKPGTPRFVTLRLKSNLAQPDDFYALATHARNLRVIDLRQAP